MDTNFIRDGRNQIIGSTNRLSNGDTVARDRSGRVLGHSSERFGNTRDSDGRLVSQNSKDTGLLFRR